MQISDAQRKKARIKMCIQGPSGSGKSYSSLLVSFGITTDWNKIAVIDTENGSANLYAALGAYKVVQLLPPFTPEKYIEAISLCENHEIEVIIIDSLTHEWEYLLDYHSSLPGNSFTNWSRITPRHNDFIQKMLRSPCHIIATSRTKQDYVLVDRNGKQVPEKVGLKTIQRDGIEYEFTLVFDLDIRNNASCSKDRTGLFFGKPEQKITPEIGKQILSWCNDGKDISVDDVSERINSCKSIGELLQLYNWYPQYQQVLQPEFEARKRNIIVQQQESNSHLNGTVV